MSTRTLSNPSLEINDDVVAYVPNSLSYKEGSGDKEVKAQTSGGNSISVVVTENAETKISNLKFKLFNTAANLNLINTWSANLANTAALSEGEISVSFRDMVVCTEPERAIGADGELEIEFKGAPVV